MSGDRERTALQQFGSTRVFMSVAELVSVCHDLGLDPHKVAIVGTASVVPLPPEENR
jgi:hypothetical protein